MKVLILGASGMLGHALFRVFSESPEYETFGSVRSPGSLRFLPPMAQQNVVPGIDVENFDNLTRVFGLVRPHIVINCIGLVKQLAESEDPLMAIPINAILPHRLARLCEVGSARFIQIGTDCVFSGAKGMYSENDPPDATDLYGRSKCLGEVDYPHAVTLRTSIIGHELNSARSLVGWFLAQEGSVKGFKRAIFSGLPTVEIARVIRDLVIPNMNLRGLYHLSAEPINKFDLLSMVANRYRKAIQIVPDETLVIDRSLDSSRFRLATGFQPPPWPELIRRMHEFS